MSITVYTKPNCPQCSRTKAMLKSKGFDYEEVDVTTNEEIVEYLLSKGFRALPVVETDKEMWSGFRYDKIKELTYEK